MHFFFFSWNYQLTYSRSLRKPKFLSSLKRVNDHDSAGTDTFEHILLLIKSLFSQNYCLSPKSAIFNKICACLVKLSLTTFFAGKKEESSLLRKHELFTLISFRLVPELQHVPYCSQLLSNLKVKYDATSLNKNSSSFRYL